MGTVSRRDAGAFLSGLLERDIRAVYPMVKDAWLNGSRGGSRVLDLRSGGYAVEIGTAGLGDPVPAPDLAWAARSVFHERRHLYQKEVIYKNPMSGRDLDTAVMEACAMAYRGYNDRTYAYRLSELDADLHGMRDAVPALRAAFPDIDWGAAMLDAYNARNVRGPGGSVSSHAFREGHVYGSLDEIAAYYGERAELCLSARRGEPCGEFLEGDDRILWENRWDEKFSGLLDGDGTRTGRERDREILASVLQARAFDPAERMPGLAPELERIKAEFGVETDAVRAVKRAAWEADHGDDPDDASEAMYGP